MTVISTAFAPLAQVVGEGIGHVSLPIVVVPHPLGPISPVTWPAGTVNVTGSTKADKYNRIPAQDELKRYQAHLESMCEERTASLRRALEHMAEAQRTLVQRYPGQTRMWWRWRVRTRAVREQPRDLVDRRPRLAPGTALGHDVGLGEELEVAGDGEDVPHAAYPFCSAAAGACSST